MNKPHDPQSAQNAALLRAQAFMTPSPVPSISTELAGHRRWRVEPRAQSFPLRSAVQSGTAQGQEDRHLLHQWRRGSGDHRRHEMADRAWRDGACGVAAHRRIPPDAGPALSAADRHPCAGHPPDGERRLAEDRLLHGRGEGRGLRRLHLSRRLLESGFPARRQACPATSCATCMPRASPPAPSATASG